MSQASSLVSWARAVLEHPDLATVRAWPRAAALLGRQALEEGLGGFWDRNAPQVRKAAMRTQLVCLEEYLKDADLVHGVRHAWLALTRACHQHPYDLAPTFPELDSWLTSVEELVARLDEAAVA